MNGVPVTDFCCLYTANIPKEDAAHIDILGPIIIVKVVGTVALLLPSVMTFCWTWCLYIAKNTNPHAAQMECSASCPSGFPQMHLSPDKGSSIRCPKLNSLKIPSPSCGLTLTACLCLYGWECSVAERELPSRRDTYVLDRCGNGHGHEWWA